MSDPYKYIYVMRYMLAGTCNDKRNNTVGHDIGPIYPRECVDDLLVRLANFVFGDLLSHGIVRPKIGPLGLKAETGRSAVLDVGTVGLIKKGIIKVSIFSHATKFFLQ